MKKLFLPLFFLANASFAGLIISPSGGGGGGSGDALTTNPLSQFASTTSAQLRGVMSDELGTGALLFDGATPTALTLTNATGLPESGVTSLVSDLALKAPLASPTFTGTVTLPASTSFVTPILGTPTSVTLTNATGLPVSGITASTSTALGVGSIELGHATDTTVARSGAGAITVEGVAVPTISSTNTLTNKRVTPRSGTVASSATPTINTDNVDYFTITAQTAAITSMTTNLSGTPTDGDRLLIRIKDDGTARAITWGTSFAASTDLALPTTTTISKYLYCTFIYNGTLAKWVLLAKLDNI